MNDTTPNYPNAIILDTRSFIPEYRSQIEQEWIENVSFEEMVANIVSAYSYVPKCNSRLDELTEMFEISTYDSRPGISPRQAEFVVSVFQQLAFDLDEYLTTRGLLKYDNFPYRVETIFPDGSIVLRKTTQEDPVRV